MSLYVHNYYHIKNIVSIIPGLYYANMLLYDRILALYELLKIKFKTHKEYPIQN